MITPTKIAACLINQKTFQNGHETLFGKSKFPENLKMTSFNEPASMNVFCRSHPLAALRPELRSQGVITARQLRLTRSGRIVRVCGLLVVVHTPPVPSGKRIMFITIEDETGIMDLVMFPNAQKKWARPMLTCEVLTVQGRLQRRGKDGRSMSIAIERVIIPWTGLLSDFYS